MLKLERDEAEAIAREFVLNRLKASSVEVLDFSQGPKPDLITVYGLLEDGDGRSRKFEVRINSVTKKVGTWNIFFERSAPG